LPQTFGFGDVRVLCAERRITVAGQPVAVGGRAFDLLVALIERRSRVVAKEELLDVVWPGVVVEEANIQVQISALRKFIGSHAISTVAGHGYRFCGVLDDEAAATTDRSPQGDPFELVLSDKPSVAVLPFANASSDPEHRFLPGAVTEDITTELSRFHSLFVIGHGSTYSYADNQKDVRTIASELGVRYLVTGSVRRGGQRLRIMAQLVDASTLRHIWADHYDGVVEDIFALQEQVTRSVVTAIAPEVLSAEILKARRRRPVSLSAYELAVRAWADCWTAYRNADTPQFASLTGRAREALSIDPESTLALNALALGCWLEVFFRTSYALEECWSEGLRAAQRAIEIDASDSLGYTMKAILLSHAPQEEGRSIHHEDAVEALRTALRHNPNDHFALRQLGLIEVVMGNSSDGIEHLQQALRLNPRDPFSVNVVGFLSLAHFLARNYEEGVRFGKSAAGAAPNMPNVHVFLAMNFVGMRDMERAKSAFATARQLSAEYVDARTGGFSVFRQPEDRARETAFLRIAGGMEDPALVEKFR
jgi:adenylate cyclase